MLGKHPLLYRGLRLRTVMWCLPGKSLCLLRLVPFLALSDRGTKMLIYVKRLV